MRERVSGYGAQGGALAFTRTSALGVEERRVNVLVTPADPRAWTALGDGYRMEARITVWQRADAVHAPSSAVFRRGEGGACTRCAAASRATRRWRWASARGPTWSCAAGPRLDASGDAPGRPGARWGAGDRRRDGALSDVTPRGAHAPRARGDLYDPVRAIGSHRCARDQLPREAVTPARDPQGPRVCVAVQQHPVRPRGRW